MLEKININPEKNDSSDSNTIQLIRKQRNLIDSDSDENGIEKNVSIENNISSSEEWEDVTKSDISSTTINFGIHHQITEQQISNNIKELKLFYFIFYKCIWDNIIKETNYLLCRWKNNKQTTFT